MKIAIVHDWLNNLGGAERVLIELHRIFPDAPIYTLFQNKKFTSQFLPEADIRPSFLQKIPGITGCYKYFFFLMPTAIESFVLSDYDVVISSSAIFSKGLVLKPKTRHICYCYSPTRRLWDLNYDKNKKSTVWTRSAEHFLRIWDRQAADRVDEFVSISEHVRDRIKKYYRRDAKVVYPPVSLSRGPAPTHPHRAHFIPEAILGAAKARSQETSPGRGGGPPVGSPLANYYLIVSRLFPSKNIDIAVEAFAKLNLPLVIIGDGPEFQKLKIQSLKSKAIKLLGFVSDEELPYYYQNCKAFIMPQEEDFGLTPIEAMSYGKPVLALRKGGALETVTEGLTGEFFDDPIPEALADGVRRLNDEYNKFHPETIKLHIQKFSNDKFRDEISGLVYNN